MTRHLLGALLLLALGLAAVVVSLSGEREGAWWASAVLGLVLCGWALRWLRDLRVRRQGGRGH